MKSLDFIYSGSIGHLYTKINFQSVHLLKFYCFTRVVNSRQTNFFNFDRTRSLSLDVHESCNFKPKKRNLNSPKNAYFRNFRLFCNFSLILTYFRKNEEFLLISCSNLRDRENFFNIKAACQVYSTLKNSKNCF